MSRIQFRTGAALVAAALILHLILIQPNHPAALSWRAIVVFPLELPVILLTLLALRDGRLSRGVRAVLVGLLTLIAALKVADFISFNAFSRRFNPISDLSLIEAFIRLLTGSLGPVLTALAGLASIVSILLIGWLLWWATGIWARVRLPVWAMRSAGMGAIVALGLTVVQVGQVMRLWTPPVEIPGTAFTARLGVERVALARHTLTELRNFRVAVAEDPFADATGLLDRIDRDVLIIFIESYGRTSIDTPFYAELHRDTLSAYEARLADRGLATRSGVLAAPTRGGQSWLSHATFSNGLWVNDQIRYGAALSSGRQTLFHHAARNGFHTATVMPQITLDWPEVDRMGFEIVLVSADLGYRGLPFNWVTMPDQFTLSALDRLLRDTRGARPLFTQVALVSSHAPWVPVPEILPWEEIGDGEVFNDMATAGDPPEVVWRDRDRVRAQYRLAVDYSLQVVMEYALLHADDPPLILVVGDHQAAEFIALDDRPDVPFHVIGPAHLVEPLAPAAPSRGLLPADDVSVIPMDRMRDILLNAYSTVPTRRVAN